MSTGFTTMAKGKKKQTKSTANPARTSTKAVPKSGSVKPIKLQQALTNGIIAEKGTIAANTDSAMGTNDEEELSEVDNNEAGRTMIDKEDEEVETRVNNMIGQVTAVSEDRSSRVVNLYTSVVNPTSHQHSQLRQNPVIDCNTKWKSRFTFKPSITESTNVLDSFCTLLQGLLQLPVRQETVNRVLQRWNRKGNVHL
jgi:hypothetical protein